MVTLPFAIRGGGGGGGGGGGRGKALVFSFPTDPVCGYRPKIHCLSLQVRYRADLDLVLKGLSFSIKAGEKVGLIGRTGCGKSTLMSTLLRIVEPSEGQILIDGVDLAGVPLHDLRSRIALVPQVSVLLSRLTAMPFLCTIPVSFFLEHTQLMGVLLIHNLCFITYCGPHAPLTTA